MPPTPPFALISSTAISIEALPATPHSAPLPVTGARQPIFTLRPASCCACTSCAAVTMPASVSEAATAFAIFIGLPSQAEDVQVELCVFCGPRWDPCGNPNLKYENLHPHCRFAHGERVRRADPDKCAAPG